MQSHQIIIDVLPAKPGFTQINVQGGQHMGGLFAHIHANIGQPTIYRWWVNYCEHSLFISRTMARIQLVVIASERKNHPQSTTPNVTPIKQGTPIVNGTQRFLALQNSKPEARLS